ncbi:MAG: protein jag [Clostridiales bacterium]|jgi:spoIIIJ-associated protein|nr:protein jag [Clostridiales bacterium]
MEYSEKWGNDVEAAVELALTDLNLTINQVDITVLEEPSKGFFGIGSKLAKVRVMKKEKAEENVAKKEVIIEKAVEKQIKKEEPEVIPEVISKHNEIVTSDYSSLDVVEEHPAKDFLKNVTENMGLDFTFAVRVGENLVHVDIEGKDTGTIIGKRGQTLDSIQYLTSLAINKGNDEYTRVILDAENYRAKREKTLIGLANRLAEKVVRTKKSVKLEPMNPYERKIIHSTLQSNSSIVTRSEGQDPYRRVVIELK